PRQLTIVSSLQNLVPDVRAAALKPPAVIVVGDVVNLRAKLRWFDSKPLFGKRILVTRARDQAGALSEMLRAEAAEPVEFPVIKVVPPDSFGPLDAALGQLPGTRKPGDAYQWVIFTSANGVRFTSDRLAALGLDARAFGSALVAAIG